jgi:transposase InsO family protein
MMAGGFCANDASRFIIHHGVFTEATTDNAIQVLKEAIAKHGRPASILTDHGSQFYANQAEINDFTTSKKNLRNNPSP